MESSHLVSFFYKLSQTLDIWLHWILIHVRSGDSLEGYALFLRVLYFLNVSKILVGASEVVGKFSNYYCAIWPIYPIQYPRGSPLLFLGRKPSYHSSDSASVGYCSSLCYGFYWGFSEVIGRIDLRLRSTPWEVCSLPYVFIVLWQRSVQWDSSLLSAGIFCVAVFPHVVWGGEDKKSVIEEFVSNIFHVFYSQLTFSRIDFEKFRTR